MPGPLLTAVPPSRPWAAPLRKHPLTILGDCFRFLSPSGLGMLHHLCYGWWPVTGCGAQRRQPWHINPHTVGSVVPPPLSSRAMGAVSQQCGQCLAGPGMLAPKEPDQVLCAAKGPHARGRYTGREGHGGPTRVRGTLGTGSRGPIRIPWGRPPEGGGR